MYAICILFSKAWYLGNKVIINPLDYLVLFHIGVYASNLCKQKAINKQVFCILVYLGHLLFNYRIK